MLIAQVTDTHIKTDGALAYRKVDTAANLARCVDHLGRTGPRADIVLMTGDLVDFGRPEEYRLLRRLIAPLGCPVYVIPGNHDDRENLRRAFSDHDYLPDDGEFLHYAVEDHPVRLVGLDTTIPGAPGGILCARRLQWLDRTLAEAPDRPTAIFMHHPPFLTGITHMDVQNCDAGDALGALIESHPQVMRVMCGHVPPADSAPMAWRDGVHRPESVTQRGARPARGRPRRASSSSPPPASSTSGGRTRASSAI